MRGDSRGFGGRLTAAAPTAVPQAPATAVGQLVPSWIQARPSRLGYRLCREVELEILEHEVGHRALQMPDELALAHAVP